MSDALRNSIWNFVVSLFDEGDAGWRAITESSAQFYFKVPVDDLPGYNYQHREWIKDRFYAMPWHGVYDYAEFIAQNYERVQRYPRTRRDRIENALNHIFAEELSGYRFLAGELAPISGPEEVAAIEGALSVTSHSGLTGAHAHITAALQLLAKRPDPDYRNSVKESISAVEALAKQLGTADSQGLAGAWMIWVRRCHSTAACALASSSCTAIPATKAESDMPCSKNQTSGTTKQSTWPWRARRS
jgi:hypothetical protein